MPSAASEKLVELQHHGNGWIEFFCPLHDENSHYVLNLTSDLKISTDSNNALSKANRLKLKLLGFVAPKNNGNVIIELLFQALANDGTISLNSYIKQDDHIPAEMPVLWANIQFDGDINFVVNRIMLEQPQFDAYAQGFIAVQNAFIQTMEQTLQTMRKSMLYAMRTLYALPFLTTGGIYWQEITHAIVKIFT